MSSGTEGDEPGVARKALRTVTPPYRGRPDVEMTSIGVLYFLGIVVLLIPLLPFMLIGWLLGKLLDAIAGR